MGDGQTEVAHAVIIGSSSGGIDALSTLVRTLPQDFPTPILIAQHLDPARPSSLAAILGNQTALPVQPVEHHADLEPGMIYVIPANRQVDFDDQQVRVVEESVDRPRPSIDRLLETAAAAFGDRLIAVILTGAGSDGTAGARAVKAADGTVLIQNPKTAEYASMPRSLAPTTVDLICELDEFGPILTQLIEDPASVLPEAPSDGSSLEAFLEHIQSECHIDFNQDKTPTILRRLKRRMAATDTNDFEQYFDYLVQHPRSTTSSSTRF